MAAGTLAEPPYLRVKHESRQGWRRAPSGRVLVGCELARQTCDLPTLSFLVLRLWLFQTGPRSFPSQTRPCSPGTAVRGSTRLEPLSPQKDMLSTQAHPWPRKQEQPLSEKEGAVSCTRSGCACCLCKRPCFQVMAGMLLVFFLGGTSQISGVTCRWDPFSSQYFACLLSLF